MKTRRKPVVFSTVLLAAMLIGTIAVRAASTCEGLINLSLPHGQVTAAQTVTGGPAWLHNGQYWLHHEYWAPAILPGCRHGDTDERFDHQLRGLDPDGRQL